MDCEAILILGSNIDNIIENMNKLRIGCKYTIIKFNDNNSVKKDAIVVDIEDFVPDKTDNQYIIVANSGTVLQLKEVVQKFSSCNIPFSLIELESDKVKKLWPELIK